MQATELHNLMEMADMSRKIRTENQGIVDVHKTVQKLIQEQILYPLESVASIMKTKECREIKTF